MHAVATTALGRPKAKTVLKTMVAMDKARLQLHTPQTLAIYAEDDDETNDDTDGDSGFAPSGGVNSAAKRAGVKLTPLSDAQRVTAAGPNQISKDKQGR